METIVPEQPLNPLLHSVGEVPVSTTERVTYQCTFRNLWTKERNPINYPEEDARWDGPLLWTHTTEFMPWQEGQMCSPGVQKLAEVRAVGLMGWMSELSSERVAYLDSFAIRQNAYPAKANLSYWNTAKNDHPFN